MARFEVIERERPTGNTPRFSVVDRDNDDLPVADFDARDEAQTHADRLEQGPFDWDEQEAWQDEWDDDDWGQGD